MKGQPILLIDELGKSYSDDIRVSGATGRIRARFGTYFKSVNAKEGDVIEIVATGPGKYTMRLNPGSSSPQVAASLKAPAIPDTLLQNEMKPMTATNTILYGPPGTGKTYSTALRAVQICAPDWPLDASDNQVRAKYEELRKAGRISFVTFHQSYGYEDFVEGIRPVLQTSGQVSYSVVPGAFRRACDSARLPKLVDPGLSGKPLQERKIFKMSLGASWNDEGVKVFKYCLENRCVLMGWGADVDFSDCGNAEAISEKLKQEAPEIDKFKSQVAFVDRFKNELEVGDILVVSHGNKAFRGIAEVTGEYEFDEDGPFHQARPVKWLAVFESGRPASEVNAKDFNMRSLHQLHDVNYEGLQALLVPANEFEEAQPHVLIIDEINRANISKVFGELITLLEPDKREGMPNAITLKLAYSGDDFTVPSNLHVIGTMNTADRSIALLDTALRRRFEFEELQPDYDTLTEGLVDGVDLRAMLKAMNNRIEYLYDRDHTIGHAYFMGVDSLEKLQRLFRHKIIPLLQEYFYEDWAKVRLALNDNVGAFIEKNDDVPKGLESVENGYDTKPRYKVRDGQFLLEAYLKIYQYN
jgi:5-methylcytosine-specific restriction protein B